MAILLPFLLTIVAIIAAGYLYFKKSFRFWKSLGFPYADPSTPWGNLHGVATGKSIGHALTKVYKDHPNERFIGMWMFFRPALLIRDPELIKSIFVRDFMSFHDRGVYVNEKVDPLSGHLFSLSGTKWRNLRVKMTPTFTSGKMKMMFPILVNCSKHFKDVMEAQVKIGENIEVKDYCSRFTTDIISLCAFGIETNSLKNPDSDFRHYGSKVFDATLTNISRGLLQVSMPGLARFLQIRGTDKGVADFFMTAIRETMDYREENNVRRNDFMDLLIQLKNKGQIDDVDTVDNNELASDSKDVRKFTFEEAAAQAFVFFIAGFETSSTTMQFALYELAKHPEVQAKTREEIQAVLKRHNGELSYDSLIEMEYLSRVVDETLRLYPPLPFLQRESNKAYQLPGTDLVIPEGTQVLIDILGLHHDSKYYPNPEKFDPDRFTEEEKAKRHNYSYLPFGEGPRNCIGMRFGLMQTKVGLITLLSNFTFEVCEKTRIPMEFDPKSFVLAARAGMHLKVNKVNK